MNANAWLQLALYLAALFGLALPLGAYMARVYAGNAHAAQRALGWLERLLYRCGGIDSNAEMTWQRYARSMLAFNAIGLLAVYGLQRMQDRLPLNPAGLAGVGADSSFNTAVSFATNTNWQGYAGEITMSHGVQMAGLTVQNFLSAATGMAVLVALIRGFTRRSAATIGNFWFDMTRSVVYVLLPLSAVLAILLVSQGVVQNFTLSATAAVLDPQADAAGVVNAKQSMAMGPVASQVAIKQLGTNGGGFFNVNSAHPFENPTPWSNFLSVLAILLIPAALCHTFGILVGDVRQGWTVLAAMTVLFVPLAIGCIWAEQAGTAALKAAGADLSPGDLQPGGNMEGKEVRFGIVQSALWATATTAASNGSVNAMHDSFTPLGGAIPMWLMQLGEVVFGGVGSGLYGMLVFAILAVFVAGLMVGRTPEYLGKKIQAFEMKMAVLVILVPPCVTLGGAAIAVLGPGLMATIDGQAKELLGNPGPHGFSEVLYAFSSAGNNNGSAYAGLSANVPFYNVALGIAMFVARYWLALPTLAIAGSLAAKKPTPVSPGTLPTSGPLFVALLAAVVLLVGALTFIPALALGPLVEQLQMRPN